jgi:hypothetical protein
MTAGKVRAKLASTNDHAHRNHPRSNTLLALASSAALQWLLHGVTVHAWPIR